MSNKEISNDTLLIVNAIQEQTKVIEKSLKEVKNDTETIKCERCIDKKINFFGKDISLTTLLYILTVMNTLLLGYSLNISPSTITGILTVL